MKEEIMGAIKIGLALGGAYAIYRICTIKKNSKEKSIEVKSINELNEGINFDEEASVDLFELPFAAEWFNKNSFLEIPKDDIRYFILAPGLYCISREGNIQTIKTEEKFICQIVYDNKQKIILKSRKVVYKQLEDYLVEQFSKGLKLLNITDFIEH